MSPFSTLSVFPFFSARKCRLYEVHTLHAGGAWRECWEKETKIKKKFG